MRKQLLIGMIVGVLVLAGVGFEATVLGQTRADGSPFESTIGLSLPTFGRVHYNDEGLIRRLTGFNLGLGYSARTYRNGLYPEEFNVYWGWGTFLLILPYIEFGVSYPVIVGEKGNLLVLDLGVVYIAPRIGISILY